VADKPDELVAEPVGEGGRVGRGSHGGAVGEREELAGPVPCLAHSVCVEQERVARLKRDSDRDARHIGQVAQAEGQAALLLADKPGRPCAEEQRFGMAAAEQLDLGTVGADLGEDSGDELLIAQLAG
jgi:hypothetical protein